MGGSWKMQAKVDRFVKKVQDSTEAIEIIRQKLYDAENANQKERFEADLKKEIKKLLKCGDHHMIKNWQSSDIKNKKGLTDAKMAIQKELERFKAWEKETKIKAFSREGLVQQLKMDPKEKEKSETRDWLNKKVSDLNTQIDEFETNLERLYAEKLKAGLPRLRHWEESITRHRAHIRKLELMMRHVDNDELSTDQVNDVMEFVDDYVERNQEDFDEFNDVDEIYSSLALDKLEGVEDIVRPARAKVGGALRMKHSSKTVAVQSMATVSSIQQSTSVQEQAKETTSRGSNPNLVARTSPWKLNVSSVPVTPAASNPSPGNTNIVARTSAWKVNISSVPVTPAASNPSPGDTVQSSQINKPISTKEEDTSDTPVSGIAKSELSSWPSIAESLQSTSEITKQNALGADERAGTSEMVQVLESSSSNRIILPQTAEVKNEVISSADIGNAADGAVTAGKVFSPPAIPGMQCRPGSPYQEQNDQPTSVHPQSAQQDLLSEGLIDTDVGLNKVEETQHPLSDVIPSTVPSKNPMNDDLKASYDAPLDASVGVASESMTEPGELPRNIDIGAIDDDFEDSTANSGVMHDQAYNLLMLEAAFQKLPQPGDYKRVAVTPSSYPQKTAPFLSNPAFWVRAEEDILFYAFYYQKNSCQQEFASQELKKQQWRYHKEYDTWFRRLEEPRVITEEYEKGDYEYCRVRVMHDDGWCMGQLTNYTLEYKYLEEDPNII